MSKLPESFCQAIRHLLAEDGLAGSFASFLASFEGKPSPALRLNGLKGRKEELWPKILFRFGLEEGDWEKVSWTQESYYLPDFFLPSQTVAYLQGLFYLQEASATLPATVLSAKPGDLVLDLCAAPGGKSTKLLSDMNDEGLLVCNEINLDRARVLLRNLEQWGGTQTILTHCDPLQLKASFPRTFDKILVDAPCSGEGMFLRDPKSIKSWEEYSVSDCAVLQSQILDCADEMLKPGGELVYSTCTFNRQENEERIVAFIQKHPGYEIVPARERLPKNACVLQSGIPQIEGLPTENTLRIWPHQVRGEGHFCALLRKNGEPAVAHSEKMIAGGVTKSSVFKKNKKVKAKNKASQTSVELDAAQALAAFEDFAKRNLTAKGYQKWYENVQSRLYLERNYLHLAPVFNPSLDGIHLLKRGLLLGEIKVGQKAKFTPSHAWALAASCEDFRYLLSLSEEDPRVLEYIAGQTIALETEIQEASCRQTVHVLFAVEGYPLGFLQSQPNGMAKNLYPQAWVRRLRSPWEAERI